MGLNPNRALSSWGILLGFDLAMEVTMVPWDPLGLALLNPFMEGLLRMGVLYQVGPFGQLTLGVVTFLVDPVEVHPFPGHVMLQEHLF